MVCNTLQAAFGVSLLHSALALLQTGGINYRIDLWGKIWIASAIYMDSSGWFQAVSGVPVDSSERCERAGMLLLMSLSPKSRQWRLRVFDALANELLEFIINGRATMLPTAMQLVRSFDIATMLKLPVRETFKDL